MPKDRDTYRKYLRDINIPIPRATAERRQEILRLADRLRIQIEVSILTIHIYDKNNNASDILFI